VIAPWSPTAARKLVQREIDAAIDAGHYFTAAALRRMLATEPAAFESGQAFAAWLRGEDLHSKALLALAEPRVAWRPA
jgi:hypothetical protein